MDSFNRLFSSTIRIRKLFQDILRKFIYIAYEYTTFRDFSESFELWLANSNIEYEQFSSEDSGFRAPYHMALISGVLEDFDAILERIKSQQLPDGGVSSCTTEVVNQDLYSNERSISDEDDSEPESNDDRSEDVMHEKINLCLRSLFRLSSILSDLGVKSSQLSLKVFIECGVDFDIQADKLLRFDQMALHRAAGSGHSVMAELICKHEANDHIRSSMDKFVLSSDADLRSVVVFRQKAPSIDRKSQYGKTALHMAVENGHSEVIKVLLQQGASIDIIYEGGTTSLHMAAERDHSEVVELLLQHGAFVDCPDELRRTALYIAASGDHLKTIKILLQQGASVYGKDKGSKTALHAAAEYGHLDVIELLIQHGASVGLRDGYNRTALYFAATYNHSKAVDLLLQRGANVNSSDHTGQTALHVAAENGNLEVVKVLLQHRADANIKDELGITALGLAVRNRQSEVTECIARYKKNGSIKQCETREKDPTGLRTAH